MNVSASVSGPATVDGRPGTLAGTLSGAFTPAPVPAPVPDFGPDPDAAVVSGQFAFENLTTGEAASYLWVFGDGTTSTAPTPPPHTYAAGPGTYSVTLVATGPGGARGVTKDVAVP